MKVLRVISHLEVGGVQRQLLLIFRALRDLGVDCSVCCIDKLGTLAEKFEEENFPVHHCRFSSRLNPKSLVRLRKLIKNEKFDVVHSHMYAANMSTNASLFGRRKVALVNGYHNQIFYSSERQKKKVVRSANKPDAFVAVGENVRKALIEAGLPEKKIKTITNGVVGPEDPLPLPEPDPGGALRVMWAGRFVTQKRVDFLIEVAKACREAEVNVRFSLYGEGPKWFAMRNLINQHNLEDMVVLPGVTNDVFEAYKNHELYVSASYREGFPNALLEACIAGRPVVVSDIDPHLEVLSGKEAGYCLPVKPEEWVQAFRDLIRDRDKLKKMAENSRNTGLEHHISQTAKKKLEFYEEILKNRQAK